jgi:ribosomal protein S18 acetylase RimI-like enzyme
MSDMNFRPATESDLPAIIAMLADDELGSQREAVSLPLNQNYQDAFAAIERDPNQLLVVVELQGSLAGCCQLSVIPGLSRRGMWRAQIESVRVAASHRGEGLGRQMFEWAIAECRSRGCGLQHLTTDKSCKEARRFYESLGFTASHEGMKLSL